MSAFGDAAMVPPEVNHTLMRSGDLGASLLAAAAAYEALADMLLAELTAMGTTTSMTAAAGWQGPGGVMMQMTAMEFMAICAAASAWIRIGQVQAAEVAAAHAAALESMIPAEVCTTNRVTQSGLIASNIIGQNSPAIAALEVQYQEAWAQNAAARTGYGAVASTAVGLLSEPPPLSPTAANPAGPAAAVAETAAQKAGQSALQASAKTMTQTADTASAPRAAQSMSSFGGQAGSLFGQVGSVFGQAASAGQQLPSMLGQAPGMFSGLLGPLSSMSGFNTAGALTPGAAGAVAAPVSSLGGLTGGGGGGMVSGSSALSSTFVRPANSFSSPNTPTLPAGWQGNADSAAPQIRPAGTGGGLYGAPAALGRDGSGSESAVKPTRAMQVTARPTGRGEPQRT